MSDANTDTIDASVHQLIDRHLDGQLGEQEVRRQISGLLYASDIHREVANQATNVSRQTRRDLADRLGELVTKKVIGTRAGCYDLYRGRQTSACGWARSLLREAVWKKLQNMYRENRRNGYPWDPNTYAFEAMAQDHLVWQDSDTTTSSARDGILDVADAYAEAVKGARATDRTVVNSEALCYALDLVAAVRPESWRDREHIHTALLADESLARRSVHTWQTMVYGEVHDETAGNDAFDPKVLMLWDDQTPESARWLIDNDAWVAHTLGVAATQLRPRPRLKAISKLKTSACRLRTGKDWRELSRRLVDSWVAVEFEPVSQYSAVQPDDHTSADEARTQAREGYDDLLLQAAEFDGHPLGDTTEQVRARLERLLVEVSPVHRATAWTEQLGQAAA